MKFTGLFALLVLPGMQEGRHSKALLVLFAVCLGSFTFSACTKKGFDERSLGPPEVLVTDVIERDVPIIREWIGSLDGSVNADVRARVSGYVISQNYKEGRLANKGDLLFQIDPSTYEAAVEQSKSALAQAQANQLQTEITEKREIQLFDQKAESQQNRDNAVQSNAAAKAEVQSQQAILRQAQLNLDFTRITAPITGIAGIANPGIGDLVGPSDANPLTTISTVDPIKTYFKISEQDYLRIAGKMGKWANSPDSLPQVEIVLADGSLYPHKGKFLAVDREIDQTTGTIRLAALFPNSENILRPGGFVRVRVTILRPNRSLLVPQRAVTELQTSFEVVVINGEGKAETRMVKPGEQQGSLWIIDEGLHAGDRVVVEGAQRVRDGQSVKAMPWAAPIASEAQ
jgi:membrane fusion protein (multidrug efflux system)